MPEESRKFTKAEREELEGIVAVSTQTGRAVLFFAAVLVMAGLFRLLQSFFPIDAPAWVLPTGIVAYLLYRRAGRWTGGPALRRLVREDIAGGEARVLRVRPVEVTEFEEEEDEGPAFLVRTDDEQWLLLSGQELVRPQQDGFPWSEFGIAEAPHSGTFFGLEKFGEPIPVDRKLPQMPYELARDLGTFKRTVVVLDEPARALLDTAVA